MSDDSPVLPFDEFAANYDELLRDPIRERFAPGSAFFATRKILLLRRFFAGQGIDMRSLDWLDIGCGRGELLRSGRDSFRSIAGCDLSVEMLRGCPDLPTRLQTSATDIPFSEQSFDLVTLVCVLHHVAPDERGPLIAEAMRVTKPGGWVCVIEHNAFNPVTRLIVSRTPIDSAAQLLTAHETRRLLSGWSGRLKTRYFLYLPESMFQKLEFIENCLAQVPLGGQYAVFGQVKAASAPPQEPRTQSL